MPWKCVSSIISQIRKGRVSKTTRLSLINLWTIWSLVSEYTRQSTILHKQCQGGRGHSPAFQEIPSDRYIMLQTDDTKRSVNARMTICASLNA
jgi:hypothetical protein